MSHIWRVTIAHHYSNKSDYGLMTVSTKTIVVASDSPAILDLEKAIAKVLDEDYFELKNAEYIGELVTAKRGSSED